MLKTTKNGNAFAKEQQGKTLFLVILIGLTKGEYKEEKLKAAKVELKTIKDDYATAEEQ